MRDPARPLLALALWLVACGAPATSSPAAPADANPLTAPSEAETREISMEVEGLI